MLRKLFRRHPSSFLKQKFTGLRMASSEPSESQRISKEILPSVEIRKPKSNGLCKGKKMAYYEVIELQVGYSHTNNVGMAALCTCTLIKGTYNCIVNTTIPSNSELLSKALLKNNIEPQDIHYVICTNGDSAHIGNNHLFLESAHIIGHSMTIKDIHYPNKLSEGKTLKLDRDLLKIIPTPGRTLVDITVLVKTKDCVVAITGGLIEKKEDLINTYIWLYPRPECPSLQRHYRGRVVTKFDRVIPGRGPGFSIDRELRLLFWGHKEDLPLSLRELYRLGLS